ncbi:MAG: trigger factor [Eubacteriales bacterium]|nr:trigger factor [Eubacteriales bacterium]
MNVKVENVEKNVVQLELEFETEKFSEGLQKAYLKNKNRFSVPGFRKGKVPMLMVLNYYGEEVLYEDAVNILFPEAYDQAVSENSLEPVERPEIDVKQIGKGQNLILTAKVTVKPEVKLGEYLGVEVQKQEVKVSDEDVENELKQVQKRNARILSADDDKKLEKDNIAVIDYEGVIDEVPFEGGKGDDHQLTIGSGQFIPGFEDQLIGAAAGDEVDVKVTFPEDYHGKDVAGKEALFKVKVKQIKINQLPELDDEFAKDVSEFDTLEEYKKDLRAKLEKKEEERVDDELKNEVVTKAVENAEIDIPKVMVDNQIEYIIRDFEMTLRYQGINMEQYFEITGNKEEDFRESLRERAEKEVKQQLVIEKIGKEENIPVSDEALNAEIASMAESYKQSAEDFKKHLRDEDIEYIKENLKVRETVNFLVAKASVK